MSQTIDTLRTALAQTQDPATRLELLNELGWHLRNNNLTEGIAISQTAYELATTANLPEKIVQRGVAYSRRNLAWLYYQQSQYDLALTNALEAQTLLESLADGQAQADVLNIIGRTHRRLGNYPEALAHHLQALELCEALDHKLGQGASLSDVGVVYRLSGDFEQALKSYQQALALQRQIDDKFGQATSLNNLTLVYRSLKAYDKGLEVGQECLALTQKTGNIRTEVHVLNNMGLVYLDQGNYQEAIKHFQTDVERASQHGYQYNAMFALLNLGKVHFKLEAYPQALDYLQQALTLAESIEAKSDMFECHRVMAEVYKKQGDLAQALSHYEQFFSIKELVFNAQADLKVKNLQVLHNTATAKQEAEIYQLQNVALEQEIAERKRIEADLRTARDEAQRRADQVTALAEVGQEVTALLDLPVVLQRIVNRAQTLLRAKTAAIYLRQGESEVFQGSVAVGAMTGPVKAHQFRVEEGIFGSVVRRGEAEIVNQPHLDPRSRWVPGAEAEEVDGHLEDPILASPLISRGEVIGLMALWRDYQFEQFQPADLNFLVNLARYAAIAIENARLYGEAQRANQALSVSNRRMNEELALARAVQYSLLLPPKPNWANLSVYCHSVPAHQVGGDFYFYRAITAEMAPFEDEATEPEATQRYVLAVGDVSGKGASAALIMASSLSQLDASFMKTLSPAQRMVYLDRAILPYTRLQAQNCALCYVELTPTVTHFEGQVVNAGCIPPFIKRQKSHEVFWPELGGPALGQGLGVESGYQAEAVALYPGDMLILTSDGVAEAVNLQGEMFGFPRLEQAVRHGPMHSPRAMVDYLLGVVTQFVAGAEANDDLTIVVVQC